MSWALLWLQGPLQSWGADSRFGRRYTLPFPTRSGILGLVCCAMGLPGEQREWLARWQGLRQLVSGWRRENVDPAANGALLRDFQMVGSGYDIRDKWQDMLIPKTSEGKRPVGGGSKITCRYYLQDAAFSCALQLPENEEDKVAAALEHPIWSICLGRKTCVPSRPVFAGLFSRPEAALARAEEMAKAENRIEYLRVSDTEPEGGEGEKLVLHDVPLAFGTRKIYGDRTVFYMNALPQN